MCVHLSHCVIVCLRMSLVTTFLLQCVTICYHLSPFATRHDLSPIQAIIGSFRNDDGDGNENVKKKNIKFARASHLFIFFCAVTARLRRENA